MEVCSKTWDISRRRLKPRLRTLAASIMVSDRSSRLSLESMLTRIHRGVRLLVYADGARYDEASMRLKTDGGSSYSKSFTRSGSSDALCGEAGAMMSASAPWSPDLCEQAVTLSPSAKLLQSES